MYIGEGPFERKVTKQLLLEHLPISAATAARYIKDDKLPAMAQELLELKALGKAIPDTWRGFRFCNEHRLWSDTDYSFSCQSLDQINFLFNESHFHKMENEQLKEYISYLETVKPRATVTRIDEKQPRPSLTLGKANNPLFQKNTD